MVHGGEWWRPITALFLHADGAHLLGNALLGGVFCVLVAHAIGAFRGWLLILACGAVANAINAAARLPEDFRSLGASTATFAALGLLVGHATRLAWMMRSFHGFRMLFVPLVAGGILLGWFGGGGADAGNIDVAGHILGWLIGVCAGFFLGKPVLINPPGRIDP
jgi:rhomboid protease GluP